MRLASRYLPLVAFLTATLVGAAKAAELAKVGSAGTETVDYLRQVKPLLAARCFACHGALKQEGNLRLDTVAAMRRGGDSGPAVVSRDVNASVLLARISASDASERMPPEGQAALLKPEE